VNNLAGKADCDAAILRELERSRISAAHGPRTYGEVSYSVTGRLGDFTFRRAWYYWIVEGRVPLAVAETLYADPVGRTDVRVGGHCGCPSPREYGTTWVDPNTGKVATSLEEKARCNQWIASGSAMSATAKRVLDECVFTDTPEADGLVGFVDLYHIDTEVGLRLFADTVRHLQAR
jgi:hypothetical protein